MIDTKTLDVHIEKYAAQFSINRAMLDEAEASGDVGWLYNEIALRLVRRVGELRGEDELRTPKRWQDAFVEQHRNRRGWRGWVARFIERRHPVEWKTWRASEMLPNFAVDPSWRDPIRIYRWQQTGGWDYES